MFGTPQNEEPASQPFLGGIFAGNSSGEASALASSAKSAVSDIRESEPATRISAGFARLQEKVGLKEPAPPTPSQQMQARDSPGSRARARALTYILTTRRTRRPGGDGLRSVPGDDGQAAAHGGRRLLRARVLHRGLLDADAPQRQAQLQHLCDDVRLRQRARHPRDVLLGRAQAHVLAHVEADAPHRDERLPLDAHPRLRARPPAHARRGHDVAGLRAGESAPDACVPPPSPPV